MVTDAIIDWWSSLVEFLLGTFPTIEVPDWLQSISSVAGLVFGYADSMGVWFPSALAATVAASIIAAWGIAFGIKAARIVVSHFTGGGGAA